MNINEYVKGKCFNDLSTDGYDWSKWCADNNIELERRIRAAGLENCERNGRILLEYISENNLPVTMDALFGVVTDARYNGRLVRIPLPPAPPPVPQRFVLGLSRKQLTSLSASQIKEIIKTNSERFPKEEVIAEIDRILALPPESEAYKPNADEKLQALGIRPEKGHLTAQTNGPTDEEHRAHNLALRRAEYDAKLRQIESLVVQQSDGSGRTNYAKTEAEKSRQKNALGTRP